MYSMLDKDQSVHCPSHGMYITSGGITESHFDSFCQLP